MLTSILVGYAATIRVKFILVLILFFLEFSILVENKIRYWELSRLFIVYNNLKAFDSFFFLIGWIPLFLHVFNASASSIFCKINQMLQVCTFNSCE